MERAPGVLVPRAEGEAVRRALLEEGLLRRDLRVARTGDDLLLPVTRDVGTFRGHPVVPAAFEPAKAPPPPWQDLVRARIPESLHARVPTSFDQVGHVVVVKLPDDLLPHARVVGEAILATNKRARTVAVDRGVTGTLRVRDLDVVAGDASTVTEHVEHGVRLRVDPARAYFSPRLATERRRVAGLVRDGERVVDLMGGVAPFALVIAKHARPARVDSVDLNPEASALARENVALNKAESVVSVHEADARAWAAGHAGVADRVITNLPHGAADFLEEALHVLKPEGGTWHYHVITSDAGLPRHLEALRARAHAVGRELAPVATREVRTYSPTERHVAVDLAITPREA